MQTIETQWWFIDLPEEWKATQEEETVIIEDVDGVGEIAITTLQKEDGDADIMDLAPLMQDVEADYGEGEHKLVGDAEGFYFQYIDAAEAVREWYLCLGHLILLITYCCDEENSGMDDGVVDEILQTIFLNEVAPNTEES